MFHSRDHDQVTLDNVQTIVCSLILEFIILFLPNYTRSSCHSKHHKLSAISIHYIR